MKVELERFCVGPMGTFGRLIAGDFECFTVERPWAVNTAFRSCVPTGTYKLRKRKYHRGGYPSYELLNVPGRTAILIHVGNTMDDLAGCIAPGMSLGMVNGRWAVTSSKVAFDLLMDVLGAGRATNSIEITNIFGGG
jgi:hypothetical protein